MTDSSDEVKALRQKVGELEQQVDQLQGQNPRAKVRSIRKRSETNIMGFPLYDIAMGPDFTKGELRGSACGIIAIGDIATGIFALGGIARGVFVIGGIALGLFSVGGVSIGVLASLGGVSVGAVAIGGVAVGIYALGGAGIGSYLITSYQQDIEAVKFFNQ